MTQQTINSGTIVNDGTGSSLCTASNKASANTVELDAEEVASASAVASEMAAGTNVDHLTSPTLFTPNTLTAAVTSSPGAVESCTIVGVVSNDVATSVQSGVADSPALQSNGSHCASPATRHDALCVPGKTSAPAYTFSTGEMYGASFRNSFSLNSVDVLASAALTHVDLHQVVGAVEVGTTITQVNGYASYVAVNCAATNGGGSSVGVGYAGGTTINVDGAVGWGIAFAMIEQQSGEGTGRKMIGGEFDFSPQYASTKVQGWVLTGIAGVQPMDADGYIVGALYGKYWQRGFVSAHRASVYAFYGGLTPPETDALVSQNSQIIALVATDSCGNYQESQLYADYAGLHLKASAGFRDFTIDNGRLVASGVNTGVELGSTRTPGTSYVDLHSSGTPNDFDARFYSTGGSSTKGNGNAGIVAASLVVPAPPAGDNSSKAATTGWVSSLVSANALQPASTSVLGGVKVGAGLLVADDGTLSVIALGDCNLLPVTSTYSASGAIAITDSLAIVNSTDRCDMTLAQGTIDGQRIWIKRLGCGVVTITLNLDNEAAVVTADSSSVSGGLSLVWSSLLATWIRL